MCKLVNPCAGERESLPAAAGTSSLDWSVEHKPSARRIPGASDLEYEHEDVVRETGR